MNLKRKEDNDKKGYNFRYFPCAFRLSYFVAATFKERTKFYQINQVLPTSMLRSVWPLGSFQVPIQTILI